MLTKLIARILCLDDKAVKAKVDPRPASTVRWPAPILHGIVVFLDFDGVLHCAESGTFEHMDRLAQILERNPDVGLVLSTSWRLHSTPQYLLDLFPDSMRSRIHGLTPDLPGELEHRRGQECVAWAEAHRVRHFIAVDDDKSLFQPDCEFVFLTDRYRALDDDAATALEIRIRALIELARAQQ